MYGIIVTARQERYSVYGEVYGSFAVAADVVYVHEHGGDSAGLHQS